MRGLLVRVGADLSEAGGRFNAPVDGNANEFCYVPIPEEPDRVIRPKMERPYTHVSGALSRFDVPLPPRLRQRNMHLDPDFEHLTYGDEKAKGRRIYEMWKKEGLDFLVFYASLHDVNPTEKRLVYAIVGFYVIDEIVPATEVAFGRCDENAHTRRARPRKDEIVVRAKRKESGRLKECVPIGSYRRNCDDPRGRPQYRVESNLLEEWGGLSVKDGWLQRSARLPQFKDANRFLKWFSPYEQNLIARNN